MEMVTQTGKAGSTSTKAKPTRYRTNGHREPAEGWRGGKPHHCFWGIRGTRVTCLRLIAWKRQRSPGEGLSAQQLISTAGDTGTGGVAEVLAQAKGGQSERCVLQDLPLTRETSLKQWKISVKSINEIIFGQRLLLNFHRCTPLI